MVFTDIDGHVVTYDGEGNEDDAYFEYASKAFDLVWNYDQLSYRDDVDDFGFYDIDGDGHKEFYLKRGTCEADYIYEFYYANMYERTYDLIGEIEGSHSYLEWSNGHLYLVGGHMDDSWKYEISILNGKIIIQ
jgi:hypothetical protein